MLREVAFRNHGLMPSRKPMPNKSRSRFGKNVAMLRASADLTQEKTAEALGLSTRYFQDIEHGRYFPSFPVLLQLRRVLNCRWDALFDGCDAD